MPLDDPNPPLAPIGWNAQPPEREPAILKGMCAVRRGDFLDFYEQEKPFVERFLMLLGASRHDAQDAVQEAFADGWRLVTQNRWAEVDNPRAWVRQVAHRRYLRPPGSRRRVASEATAPENLPDVACSDHAEPSAQALTVLDVLKGIDDPEARAVIALDIDGFRGAEIAEFLCMGDQRVRDLRKKARGHLRRHLADITESGKESRTDD